MLQLSTSRAGAQRYNDCAGVGNGASCIKNPDKCGSPSCRRSKCWEGDCLTKNKYEKAKKNAKDSRGSNESMVENMNCPRGDFAACRDGCPTKRAKGRRCIRNCKKRCS